MNDPFFDLVKHIIERSHEENNILVNTDNVVVPVKMSILGKKECCGRISHQNIIIEGEYEDLQGRRVPSRHLRLTLPQACRIAEMLMDAVKRQIEAIEEIEEDESDE